MLKINHFHELSTYQLLATNGWSQMPQKSYKQFHKHSLAYLHETPLYKMQFCLSNIKKKPLFELLAAHFNVPAVGIEQKLFVLSKKVFLQIKFKEVLIMTSLFPTTINYQLNTIKKN